MASRRNSIALTDEEQNEWLAGRNTLQVASNGPSGHPHLVAMWYAMVDGDICFSTYGKSQKIQNLRRDPKISCMLEDGDEYEVVRGLVIEGTAEIIEEQDEIFKIMGMMGAQRSGQPPQAPPPASERKPTKRVIVRVKADKIFSWDHSKLPTGVH